VVGCPHLIEIGTAVAAASNNPSARNQIDHGHYQRDHKKHMNEVAGYVESPAEKPEDQENRKYRPKHRITFATGEWHFLRVLL